MKYCFLILVMLATTSWAADTNFFKKIVSNHDRHSYFIVVKICSPLYTGKIVVEGSDFYNLLTTESKMTEASYEKLVINKLTKDECIKIRTLNDNLIKVTSITAINKTAQKGSKLFIDTYFRNNVLKGNVSNEYRAAIISKLFEWEIACKIDDESGYLVIVR